MNDLNTSLIARSTGEDIVQPNYPRNLWWVAATSAELNRDKPLGLWLLDEPVVLYRKSDGAPVALDNRCPHRWAPLSEGKVVGDDIVCPYHGFQFCPEGACVKIPSQETIPSRARVHSYPVIEKDTLIWIWMGDPEKAAQTELPCDTSWLAPDSQWSYISGYSDVDANYQLLKENVLDLTHIPHIHAATIGAKDWTNPPKVETTEKSVTFIQEFAPAPLIPIYGIPTGIGMEKSCARKNWGTSHSPAVHRGFVEIIDPDPAPGARPKHLFSVMHIVTPESPTRFRYRWFMGWDFQMSEDWMAGLRANVPIAYEEDKVILEHVQRMILRDPRHLAHPEIIVQADQAAIQSRRKLQALLDKERVSSIEEPTSDA